MKQEKKIAYEPHPVSAERKAELVKQGFQIVDAIFQPESERTVKVPEVPEDEAPKRRGRPPKSQD